MNLFEFEFDSTPFISLRGLVRAIDRRQRIAHVAVTCSLRDPATVLCWQ